MVGIQDELSQRMKRVTHSAAGAGLAGSGGRSSGGSGTQQQQPDATVLEALTKLLEMSPGSTTPPPVVLVLMLIGVFALAYLVIMGLELMGCLGSGSTTARIRLFGKHKAEAHIV